MHAAGNRFSTFLVLLLIVSGLVSSASAASMVTISTLTVSADPVTYEEPFSIIAGLSGDTCDSRIEFYMDNISVGNMFSVKLDIACADEAVSGEWTESDWGSRTLVCGTHTVIAQLYDKYSGLDSKSIEIVVGNVPKVSFEPEGPITGKDVKITLRDRESGRTLEGVKLEIHYIAPFEGDKTTTATTDMMGVARFTPSNTGKYRMVITNSRKYCGELYFQVKRTMLVDGPHPENPLVDELIQVAVPGSVGAKVLNSKGNVYLLLYTPLNGGINFTINDPGTYTLVIGDQDPKYWGINKTLTVSKKIMPSVIITPDMPVTNDILTIMVSDRGTPIGNASVTIRGPEGIIDTFSTISTGKISYTPYSVGEYTIRVDKDRYESMEKIFSVRNSLKVEASPEKPIVDKDITVTVKSHDGGVVGGALVSILETGVSGLTDAEGKYTLKLQDPGDYTMRVEKARYWNLTQTLSAYGELVVNLSAREIEVGSNASVFVSKSGGSGVEADIKVMKDNGIVDYVKASSHVFAPPEPGLYNITVSREGYADSSVMLNVKPHPLALDVSVKDKRIVAEVSSKGVGVGGITVLFDVSGESKELVSDQNGLASVEIKKTGGITVEANTRNANPDYESAKADSELKKKYKTWLLALAVGVIIILALLVIIIIQHLKGRSSSFGGGGVKMPRFGGGGGEEGQLKRSGRSSLSGK